MKGIVTYAAACALVLSLGLIGVPEVFAKAHDQGVADDDNIGRTVGESNAGGSGFVSDDRGVSGGQIGTRGDTASDAGSDNSENKGKGDDDRGNSPGGG